MKIKTFIPFSITFIYCVINAVKSFKYKDPISFTENFAQTFYWYKLVSERLNQSDNEKSVIGDDNYSKSNMFYTSRLFLNLYCYNPLIYICLSSILFVCTIALHADNELLILCAITIILTSSYFSFLLLNENYNYLGFCFYPLLIYLFNINELYCLCSLLLVFVGITPLLFIYLYYFVYLLLNLDLFNIYFILLTILIAGYYLVTLRSNLTFIILSTLKLIGAAKIKKNIFKRKIIFRKSSFILLLIESLYLSCINNNLYLSLLTIISILYILNEFNIFRFADSKSYINLFIIFNTLAFLDGNVSIVMYILSINPIVYLLPLPKRPKSFPEVNVITRDKIELDIKSIISNVPSDSRVWFAFKKPDEYYSIFSNMRDFITCLNYNLLKHNSRCLPDLHLLKSDPDCFITSYSDLTKLSNKYNFSYALFLSDEFNFEYIKTFSLINYDFGHTSNIGRKICLLKLS